MTHKYDLTLITVSDGGMILYDAASARQTRDISYLQQNTEYSQQLIPIATALELLAEAYPKNPRLPIGRPAVIRGSETTRGWYRFCRDADAELMKFAETVRCNNAVTAT